MKRKSFLKGGATFTLAFVLAVTGAAAATFREVVQANANPVHGNAVAISGSNGGYVVDFPRNVKKCSFTASLGDGTPGVPENGFVTVAGAAADPTGVYVATFNAAGAQVPRGFHLIVRC